MRKLYLALGALALVTVPSPALAEEVYLECDLGENRYSGGRMIHHLTLDEDRSLVVYDASQHTPGRVERTAATFSRDLVVFDDPYAFDYGNYITISREDLTYTLLSRARDILLTGSCKLVDPPKDRAF